MFGGLAILLIGLFGIIGFFAVLGSIVVFCAPHPANFKASYQKATLSAMVGIALILISILLSIFT